MKFLKTITLFVTVILMSAFSPSTNTGSDAKGDDIGDVATDFNLENIDGKMVSLSNFKDAKGFIIIFTCNTCPYAVAYEDRIEALNKKYASQGYPVIAIMPII